MNALAGTGPLVKLAVRRERTIAPWWLLLLGVMPLVMVSYILRNMGTPELMAAYVDTINHNSFFRALGGGFVVPDLAYMAAWRSGGFLYVLNGLAAVSAVIRHTRADEDTGRTELLRAGAVSRFAPLTASLLVAGVVGLAGGLLPTVILIAIGLDPGGSIAYGAAITAAGWVFGAIAALSAQLAGNARTARFIGLSVLGVAYLLRYAGDATGIFWLKYVSPIGWSHLVEPYWTNRWWLLAIPLAVSAILVGAAYRVLAGRDLGAGLIPDHQGRAKAPDLRGPISLSWRLHRGLLAKWAIGIGVFAAGAGGVSTLANQLVNAPGDTMAQLLSGFGGKPGAHALDYGLWAILLIFGYLIALYPVLMVQRLRDDETSGRAESVQATPMTRVRWALGHLVVAGIGTAVLLAITGAVMGSLFAFLIGNPAEDIPRVFGGAMELVPAAWLVGAISLFAYGILPRAAIAISWLTWIAVAALGKIAGPIYGVWGGTPFEPFHYLPNIIAGESFNPTSTLVMLALSAVLLGGGLLALRGRDFG